MGSLPSKTLRYAPERGRQRVTVMFNSHLLYERSCSRPCLFLFCCVSFPKGGRKKPMSKCKDQYDLANEGKNGIVTINPKLVSTHLHTHTHSWWPTSSLSRQIRKSTFELTIHSPTRHSHASTCTHIHTRHHWPFHCVNKRGPFR